MNSKYILLLFITTLLFLLSTGSVGQIYKWLDEDGNTHFSSTPPLHGEAESVIPNVTNTYSSPDQSTDSENKPGPVRAAKKVVMYSAVWCGTCKTAKNYFKRMGIAYKEYDIETSAKGRRDYKRLNGTGVPIILVGKQRMNGFSTSQFESMYGG
jgi:glutaredoxin